MAITIRNKTTEELIRKIGRRTGEGPSAVIARLVTAEAKGDGRGRLQDEEIKRRVTVFEELDRKYPDRGPKMSWQEIEREMDSIFGDDLK